MSSAKVQTFAHKSVDGLNNEPFKQLAMLGCGHTFTPNGAGHEE